jgi:hypothetical protein
MSTPASATGIRMPPQIWGPIFWATLHIASLAYSDKPTERQKKNMKNFYESMVDVLPCPICRQHYEENLKSHPVEPALKDRNSLVIWVWEMHNKINVQLGKREFSFEEFIESMRNMEKSKKTAPSSNHGSETTHDLLNFSTFEGAVLFTGVSLITGASLYYLYQETLRKSAK